ncbi:MAG: hypothetical protein KC502_19145 [Myxococcales bacterium]|nr:hypothetical protein [Myxococcales bacterium]
MNLWIAGAVIASSLSLVVTLVRRWRQRIAADQRQAEQDAEAERNKPPEGPPFGQTLPLATKTPPREMPLPPGVDPGFVGWWRKIDGATGFWLMKQAGDDGDWWVTWYAPWRRGLPERVWVGREVPTDKDGQRDLSAGLQMAWQGDGEPKTLSDRVRLWQEASLIGVDIELVQLPEGVGLRASHGTIRDGFDLGSLGALAALLEARLGGEVQPQTYDVAAVAMHATDSAEVWGDLPPFGGIIRQGDTWRFDGRGTRDRHGQLRDLWPHTEVFTVVGASPGGVAITLASGTAGELRALDGRTAQLQAELSAD